MGRRDGSAGKSSAGKAATLGSIPGTLYRRQSLPGVICEDGARNKPEQGQGWPHNNQKIKKINRYPFIQKHKI